MSEDNKNSPTLWGVFAVVFVIAFALTFELFTGNSVRNLFESKSDKCKVEAQEGAKSLRNKKLEGLRLKENPTPEDLEEIERLEIQKKTSIVDRELYEYLYEDCMR
jgi:hypothetical protein